MSCSKKILYGVGLSIMIKIIISVIKLTTTNNSISQRKDVLMSLKVISGCIGIRSKRIENLIL